MEEIWRAIPEYEGLYEASTLGRIRTAEGKTTVSKRNGERHWKSRILKGRGERYETGKRVHLWKDGKGKSFLVARLVATTFLGSPKEGDTVNHKDGNRLNNRIENLEWLSREDNVRHAFDTGLMKSVQKEVALILDKGAVFEFCSMADASAFLGRNHGYVSGCIKKGRKAVSAITGKIYEIRM